MYSKPHNSTELAFATFQLPRFIYIVHRMVYTQTYDLFCTPSVNLSILLVPWYTTKHKRN